MVAGFSQRRAGQRESRREAAGLIGTFDEHDGEILVRRQPPRGGESGEAAANDEIFWARTSAGFAEGKQAVEVVLQQHDNDERGEFGKVFV